MSEREKLVQHLLKETDAYFHMCVDFYLSGKTKKEFQQKEEQFWAEFRYDSELLKLLRAIYEQESFRTFKNTILNVSSSVVVQHILDSRTSYKLLAEVCPYIDLALLKGFLQSHSLSCDNKKIRFTFLFKVLEPILLYPASDRTTSNVKIMQAKKWFLQYTTHSSDSKPNIMDCLCEGIPSDGSVDDEWLIYEIHRCL